MKYSRIFFRSGTLLALLGILAANLCAAGDAQLNYKRERAEAMLKLVASDVAHHYYDPAMNGLNWKAWEEQASSHIEQATSNGQMLAIIFAFVNKLQDSHTIFIPPSHAARIKFGFEAEPVGKRILVYKLDKGGPAERAGLELGDQILGVNGFGAVRSSFDKMMLYFRVLDPVGELSLEVKRGDAPSRVLHVRADVKMRRVQMDLTKLSTIYEMEREEQDTDEPVAEYDTLKDGVGYVHWRLFSPDAVPLQRSLEKVQKDPAIIVDLRRNPGGALDTLRTLAGYFVQKPVVMAVAKERKKTERFKVKPRHPSFNQPMFILVDGDSASAAEIFASYFQKTHRATVIGDQTSGRVAAARIYPEKLGMEIAVLFGVEVDIGHVLMPGGKDLENRGVTPDKLCLPTPADLRAQDDPCLGVAEHLAEAAIKSSSTH